MQESCRLSAFYWHAHVNTARRTHPPEPRQTDARMCGASLGRGHLSSPPLPRWRPPRRRTSSGINETIRLMKRTQSVWAGGDRTANSCCHHRWGITPLHQLPSLIHRTQLCTDGFTGAHTQRHAQTQEWYSFYECGCGWVPLTHTPDSGCVARARHISFWHKDPKGLKTLNHNNNIAVGLKHKCPNSLTAETSGAWENAWWGSSRDQNRVSCGMTGR